MVGVGGGDGEEEGTPSTRDQSHTHWEEDVHEDRMIRRGSHWEDRTPHVQDRPPLQGEGAAHTAGEGNPPLQPWQKDPLVGEGREDAWDGGVRQGVAAECALRGTCTRGLPPA